MAQHTHYWSCSKFADWIRGSNKLKCGTSKEWTDWEKAATALHPYRFWVADEGLGHLQDLVTYPVRKIYDVKYYINNRWVTRTHSLTAHPRDVAPGTWRDVGNRFLPCLFNELVDFIEVETAWSHIAWGSKEDREKYAPPFWASGWFRWRTWRSKEAGIDHLKWAASLNGSDWMAEDDPDRLKPTRQALSAIEMLELYTWWTVDYRARKDPHELSGWSDLCEQRRLANPDGGIMSMLEDRTEEERAESGRILDLCHEIEKQQTEEDEAMMIRLIKIRDALWT